MVLAQNTIDEGLRDACGTSPSRLCEWVFEWSDSEGFATALDIIINKPLRILLILLFAFVLTRVVRRVVQRFGERLAHDRSRDAVAALRQKRTGRLLLDAPDSRGESRVNTLVDVLQSVSAVAIWTIAFLLVLGEFNVSLAPLLAGAGIVGIALGFGAQTIVADFLSGLFMLIEDQFGVGDVINTGDATGTVEKVSLRTTTLRDVNGTVWHIPNSAIRRIANKSQLWSRAVLDIEVAYDTDLRRAAGIIQRVADDLWADTEFDTGDIIDPPEVWGVEDLGADGIKIRLVVRTDPAEQWVVARELRLRIKEAFDEAGIEFPFPQRTVWVRQEPPDEGPDPVVDMADPRPPRPTEDLVDNP
ncbi:MAG: mechanosensitive ion channel family protein [Acidimicrobiales bacterium]|nr:mechanosensitive ion channel family protein [Acidimicrobiales bacterium]